MPLYLTLSRGSHADDTRPIMAISDQRFIRRVLREMATLADDERRDQSRAARDSSCRDRENVRNLSGNQRLRGRDPPNTW